MIGKLWFDSDTGYVITLKSKAFLLQKHNENLENETSLETSKLLTKELFLRLCVASW